MDYKTRIGVVGGTGAVGNVTLSLLRERGYENVRVFASARSAGKEISGHIVEEATPEALERGDIDIFLFSIGTSASRELVPHAVRGGATVVDKSSAYRLEPGIPLVVPEVNGAPRTRERGNRRKPELLHDPAHVRPEAAARIRRLDSGASGHLPVGVGRRRTVDGAASQRGSRRPRPPDGLGVRRRGVRRGVEAPRRDAQDHGAARAADPGDLRARPGDDRSRRGNLDRDRAAPLTPNRPASCSRLRRRSASRSFPHRARPPESTTCSSGESAATRLSRAASRSSSRATTCARAQR